MYGFSFVSLAAVPFCRKFQEGKANRWYNRWLIIKQYISFIKWQKQQRVTQQYILSLKHSLGEARDMIKTLQTDERNRELEKEIMQNQMKEMGTRISELKRENTEQEETMNKHTAERHEQITKLEGQIANLDKHCTNLKSCNANLENDKANLEGENTSLKRDKMCLREENVGLTSTVSRLRGERDQQRNDLEAAEHTINRLRKERNELRDENDELWSQNKKWKPKYSE